MSDLQGRGQAGRFATEPLTPQGTGKARQGVALALPTATSGIQGQRRGAEPGPEEALSASLPEGHVLGLDPGAKVSGFAVYAPGSGAILALGECHLRQDIKGRMEDRAQNRHTRRSKMWYREKRFDNRTRKPGWLPPTMESKLAAHLALVKWLAREYDIHSIIVEYGKWDMHSLTAERPLAGWQYQRGPLYQQENMKAYVRQRDDFTCQVCLLDYARRTGKPATGKAKADIRKRTQERGVEVGHLIARSKSGPDRTDNLAVLCHDHNDAMGQRSILEFGYPELLQRRLPQLKWASHVNIYVPELMRRFEAEGYGVVETRGYITKANRIELGLDKEHYTDAAVIASCGHPVTEWPQRFLRTRWMGRRRRQKNKVNAVPWDQNALAYVNKGGQAFNPVQPNFRTGEFQVGDYVEHVDKNVRGFIQAIMSTGTARVTGVRGAPDTKGTWSLKRLRIIQKAPRLRFEMVPFPHTGLGQEAEGALSTTGVTA